MSDRIVYTCATCGDRVDVPNKGFGRATAYAWLTNHQGHDVEESR